MLHRVLKLFVTVLLVIVYAIGISLYITAAVYHTHGPDSTRNYEVTMAPTFTLVGCPENTVGYLSRLPTNTTSNSTSRFFLPSESFTYSSISFDDNVIYNMILLLPTTTPPKNVSMAMSLADAQGTFLLSKQMIDTVTLSELKTGATVSTKTKLAVVLTEDSDTQSGAQVDAELKPNVTMTKFRVGATQFEYIQDNVVEPMTLQFEIQMCLPFGANGGQIFLTFEPDNPRLTLIFLFSFIGGGLLIFCTLLSIAYLREFCITEYHVRSKIKNYEKLHGKELTHKYCLL
eukprot:CAMPEP_0168508270 /NCGR_PEP_ID=MMETSP0405-20121227/20_1 /TAXON_ID=498012 /ORGANISM="Trichosphaerium sp, Strain Am-I-7 wt" /LENGTH=287 /DNA_ID=CAMNT_0008525385 /DNA_START=68 /DNA_END=931 /DNA_ORIENTATION=+